MRRRPTGRAGTTRGLLVPRSIQEDLNRRRSLVVISAVLPTGTLEVDPRTHRLKKPAPPVLPGAPPILPVWDVCRFGKVRYGMLRLPHKVGAREAEGSIKFGQGEGSADLFDPDIYTDGRISMQGIDAVLLPKDDTKPSRTVPAGPVRKAPAVTGSRKSKLR